jgi:hypothetical protein
VVNKGLVLQVPVEGILMDSQTFSSVALPLPPMVFRPSTKLVPFALMAFYLGNGEMVQACVRGVYTATGLLERKEASIWRHTTSSSASSTESAICSDDGLKLCGME